MENFVDQDFRRWINSRLLLEKIQKFFMDENFSVRVSYNILVMIFSSKTLYQRSSDVHNVQKTFNLRPNNVF